MEIGRIPIIAPGTVTGATSVNNVQAVQTILPEYQTVTQAGTSESARLILREIPVRQNEEPAKQAADAASRALVTDREVRREIEIDRDTTALVFRAVDVSTGEVVRQYPEESRLKLSAYLHMLDR
ncbi:MAG: flagellar protein FlaG [Rhizobiales bacterium]|nr:flagellar protein FlaG [Hyphomicrobiales bacterium]